MARSEAGQADAGDTPVALMTQSMTPAPDGSQPGRRIRMLAALAGIVGPVLLAAYFIVPALTGWPSAAEAPGRLAAYASSHQQLFYLGGWLQATGALLSVAFLVVLLQLSGARRTVAGSATLIGCAVLLSVVVVEAALLEAVPMAAANGDQGAVATTFGLSNGVFARIYPLVPAPLVFAGIGLALSATGILPRVFGRTALLISGLFLLAGLAAVFGSAGLTFATVMSGVEAIWIPAAAIAFARTTARGGLTRRSVSLPPGGFRWF